MPRRQPRWPSIGLNSCSSSTRRAIASAGMPIFLASSACSAVGVRQELVQRRIEQADRHRPAVHRPEQAVEVLPLERQQLGQRLLAIVERVGQDHLAEVVDVVEEHVLGAAQADAFGAEGDRLEWPASARRRWCARWSLRCFVDPGHQLLVAAVGRRLLGLERLVDRAPAGSRWAGFRPCPAKTSPVKPSIEIESPSLSTLSPTVTRAGVVVDVQIAAADDAGLAHLPADQGRVRAGAAERGENALGDLHAAQIFGAGFAADQDQLDLVVLEPLLLRRRRRGSTILPLAAPGPALMPLASSRPSVDGGLLAGRIVDRLQSWFRSSAGMRLACRASSLVIRPSLTRSTAIRTAAKPVRLALRVCSIQTLPRWIGELDVLHVLVVRSRASCRFRPARLIGLGHVLGQRLFDPLGRADAGHDVFALGVDQVVAVEARRAQRHVAGHGHAGGAVVAQVAEDHRLHVDGRAPFVRNAVGAAIDDGPVVHPAAEHGADRAPDLLHRIVGEVLAGALLDGLLELGDQLLELRGASARCRA